MAVTKNVVKKESTQKAGKPAPKKVVSKKETAVVTPAEVPAKKVTPLAAKSAAKPQAVIASPVEAPKKVAPVKAVKSAPAQEDEAVGFPPSIKIGGDNFVRVQKGISNKMVHDAALNKLGATIIMKEDNDNTALLVTFAKATLHCIDISSKEEGFKDSYLPIQISELKEGLHHDTKQPKRVYPISLYLREDLAKAK